VSERLITRGGIVVTICVRLERTRAGGRVVAGVVVRERFKTIGCILAAGGVAYECRSSVAVLWLPVLLLSAAQPMAVL
jgi:hypothetical protein